MAAIRTTCSAAPRGARMESDGITPHNKDMMKTDEKIEAAARYLVALRHGGTVTGEHGIGLLKRRALAEELDEPARDVHARLKQAFDPLGVLNPGKALPRW